MDRFIGKAIHNFAKKLWGYNRSLTGEGVRKTLNKIKQINHKLKIFSVPSGKKVFDWTVPREWSVKSAYLKDSGGKKILDYSDNNLHLLNYSCPVNKKLSLEKLNKNIFSLPEQPNAIPYVTSYYKKNWGFCMSHNMRKKLKKGIYHAYINSKHFKGRLNYGEILLKGKTKKEVLLSTNICHPSMANNELSGISVLTYISKYISEIKNRKYTYRIVFLPETIGSITYINKNIKKLKKYIYAGFNVVCIGDERFYSYLPTRNGSTVSDLVAKHVLVHTDKKFKRYSWSDRGSDERQYNAPGVDLPVASIMRSKYGTFPEYHTSLDDLKKVVTPKGLSGGFEVIKKAILVLENNFTPKVTVLCEPQLSKRNLYPSIGTKDVKEKVRLITDLISHSDGAKDLLEIANILNIPFWKLLPIANKLLHHKIIKKINKI